MVYAPQNQCAWRQLSQRVGRWTRNPAKSEDLLQTAFVRMLSSQRPVLNPHGFLLRAAGNLAIDEDRRERTRPTTALTPEHEQMLSCESPRPDAVLETRHRLQQVTAVLNRFPERTRRIFLMHRLEGCKYREIADREQISVSAVEKHIAKAALHIGELRDA